MIQKAKKIIEEQKAKLESSDATVVTEAKQVIESQVAIIKKSQTKMTEIDSEILDKWSKGKVIEFAKDLVKKKAETIEK